MEREVIVVGAGPAGAATATALVQKGHDVLLLDRKAFPRDKACGDAVPAAAIECLWDLGMKDKVDQAVARGEFYPLYQMRLVSPKSYSMIANFHKGKQGSDSYVAPRIYFDTVIQQHAIDSGVEFCVAQVLGPITENGRVVGVKAKVNGNTQEIRSQIVIGADGVTSTITRALRPPENKHVKKHRAVALRAYIEDLEENPHEVEFYLYKDVLPGYTWIFPLGNNRANIGLGMRLDHFRGKKHRLEKMLQEFLAIPAIKKRLKRGGQLRDIATWQLSYGSQKNLKHVFNGALLVGDAAGFINPLTGGGIHNALISAKLASKVIDEALQKGNTSVQNLKPYEVLCHNAMWDVMKRSYNWQQRFLRFPFLIDFLVRRMKENSQFAQTFLSKL